MNTIDDGGPAFPHVLVNERTGNGRQKDGLSLRDYFAAKAMQGITSVLTTGIRPIDVPKLAADAYAIADAMIARKVPA